MSATTVSVIIPSAGHAPSLERCLDSLRPNAIEGHLEVIVVLDGAEAAADAAIRDLRVRDGWPWPLRWVELETRRGAAAARNRGAAEAHGGYLTFIDDDMVVAPDFVASHLELLARNPNTAIVGAIKTRCIGYSGVYRNSIETFYEKRHERLMREVNPTFKDCLGGNLAMAAEVFRRVGGFDETYRYSHDLELGLRLVRAGVRLLYGTRAQALQHYRKGPSERIRECEIRGAVYARLYRSYPEARAALTDFAFSAGRRRTRRLRKWALESGWRCEALAFVLPWLPTMGLTQGFCDFLHQLAVARGARREFADEERWTSLSEAKT